MIKMQNLLSQVLFSLCNLLLGLLNVFIVCRLTNHPGPKQRHAGCCWGRLLQCALYQNTRQIICPNGFGLKQILTNLNVTI